nr:helix-turn-helix domain-containing protein [Sinirhodobacter populi]
MTVAAEPGPIHAAGGLRVEPDGGGLELLPRADTVVLPGWRGMDEPAPAGLLSALCDAHAAGSRIVSICGGAFVLAQCGLLDGKRATTHWHHAARLAARFPKITVLPDALYVDEGAVMTSAGSSAGLDLCIHLVRRDYGAQAANRVARRLVIAAHRDGGQSQFIERLLPTPSGTRVAGLLDRIRAHLDEDWSIVRMAGEAHVNSRSIQSHIRDATGLAPGEWLLRGRLSLAKELLEGSSRSVGEIAALCGLGSATNFREHFRASIAQGSRLGRGNRMRGRTAHRSGLRRADPVEDGRPRALMAPAFRGPRQARRQARSPGGPPETAVPGRIRATTARFPPRPARAVWRSPQAEVDPRGHPARRDQRAIPYDPPLDRNGAETGKEIMRVPMRRRPSPAQHPRRAEHQRPGYDPEALRFGGDAIHHPVWPGRGACSHLLGAMAPSFGHPQASRSTVHHAESGAGWYEAPVPFRDARAVAFLLRRSVVVPCMIFRAYASNQPINPDFRLRKRTHPRQAALHRCDQLAGATCASDLLPDADAITVRRAQRHDAAATTPEQSPKPIGAKPSRRQNPFSVTSSPSSR